VDLEDFLDTRTLHNLIESVQCAGLASQEFQGCTRPPSVISLFIFFTCKESFGSTYESFTFFACKITLVTEILGTSKLSHKFQVTVPKEVRERFKINSGDLIVFYDENGKLVVGKSVQK